MSANDYKYSYANPWMIRYDSVSEIEQEVPDEAPVYLEEIEGHIERHIGPVKIVFHEVDPSPVPLDVLVVPANSDRRFHYLVTAGMSDLPMAIDADSQEARDWSCAELVIALPGYWPILNEDKLQLEEWFYPILHLKTLARMPHAFNTWLSVGHSVPNATSDEASIGPGSDMTGFVLDIPWIGGEEFSKLTAHDGQTIRFLAVYPIYDAEMKLKVNKGYSHLKSSFLKSQVTEIFDPKRPSVVKTGWRRLLRL